MGRWMDGYISIYLSIRALARPRLRKPRRRPHGTAPASDTVIYLSIYIYMIYMYRERWVDRLILIYLFVLSLVHGCGSPAAAHTAQRRLLTRCDTDLCIYVIIGIYRERDG